jgi:dihydrofolate synthase / folylpolyglutamate synthase
VTYKQTLDYLYTQLPMFQRIGAAAYKADLNNTLAICKALGNPEKKFRSIHIAGTNGKGSTSHLLAAILQKAGYKTGLYTSPHLKDFRERIRVNGKMIPQKNIIHFVANHRRMFEKIEPSFFEWTVGLAFDYFANEKVDIAVIETGLGGRLDSTNVIVPELSIITNISFDHVNLLGNTLQKIAAEKAGIIKRQVPVVIGETQKEVQSVFLQKARAQKAPLVFADQEIRVSNIKHTPTFPPELTCDVSGWNKLAKLRCALPGMYQRKNIATVLAAVEELNDAGFKISEQAIRAGFREVKKITGLRGRWEILSRKPLTIADTGHNESGIQEILAQIKRTPYKNLHLVLGVVNDKDISKILSLLPKKASYYFCQAKIPRALDKNELQEKAAAIGLKGNTYASVKIALKNAQAQAASSDLVFVGGSTFVVAEVV